MSYRTIKRLFGETSLERKCRLMLGGVILVLILISFFFYGVLTEELVWDNTQKTAQLLAQPYLEKLHWGVEGESDPAKREQIVEAFKKYPRKQQQRLPSVDVQNSEYAVQYRVRLLRPGSTQLEQKGMLPLENELLEQLTADHLFEVDRKDQEENLYRYMHAVRMKQECMQCHPTAKDRDEFGLTEESLKSGTLHSAVSLTLDLKDTELAINVNRAVLLSIAIFTALVAMIIAYVIVRHVIVKPVSHLKDVSEEIANGNIAIRSNIQTGDEFQELSHAFNRMLRSLVSMQDELRKVNTDLDRKLDELAQANMALFEMNRLKSEFLATISHELRTPLNSILGFSDVLVETDDFGQKQKRWVENIQTSGQKLLGMINDILDLAKLEAGKMQVHVEEFSLRDLIEGSIQMTRPLTDKKNIVLESNIDAAIPILRQDSKKLQQIAENLLSNAIKFTPEGGRIVVSCKTDRAHLILSVTDTGVGIAADDQKLVFEKFRQAESTLTRNHGGTGLGLSIVRELAKLLGGDEVQLESELGRGSTFTVRIPMHYDDEQKLELSLGDDVLDYATKRDQQVRYFSSQGRVVGP